MLSYKSTLAIQVLYVLRQADGRGLNISELKAKTRIHTTGISQVVLRLKKEGWLATGRSNKIIIATEVEAKTLYDLVMAVEERIMLGSYVDKDFCPYWGTMARERIPHAVDADKRLETALAAMMKRITIKQLITEKRAGRAERAGKYIKIKRTDNELQTSTQFLI